jgi:putative acetyltransferase
LGEIVLIRRAELLDRAAALAVVASAFGREDEARLVERMWAAKAIEFEIVAAANEKIVGYCACSAVTIDPPVEFRVLGLAPLAVTPARQKQGVGSALVERMLEDVRRAGAGAVVLLGHPRYYPRFKFVPAATKNVRWDVRDAREAFQMIEFAAVFDGRPRVVSYHPALGGL